MIVDLGINTKQYQNKVLNFFVILLNYEGMQLNIAVSEQSSEVLCNTDDLLSCASQQRNFRAKSLISSNTEDLWSYVSEQSVTEDLWSIVYDKAFKAVNFIKLVSVYSYLGATCVQRSPR